jgi:UPF0716 protein FxsA
MNRDTLLLRFLDRTFISKLLILGLLYSLLPLGEIFLLIWLGDRIGKYITLALAASTGLLGMLFALRAFQRTLAVLKQKIAQGVFPSEQFVTLAGIFTAALLLLTPGFITDLLGFLLFVPAFRNGLGKAILRITGVDLKEIYEYLKLYE